MTIKDIEAAALAKIEAAKQFVLAHLPAEAHQQAAAMIDDAGAAASDIAQAAEASPAVQTLVTAAETTAEDTLAGMITKALTPVFGAAAASAYVAAGEQALVARLAH